MWSSNICTQCTQALLHSLACMGSLALSQCDVMWLTGKLFALCWDVVLRCNILDMPSIFWGGASLHKPTWWTIGTLMLTNLFTIYIHFSHTLAGVVITSPTLLYLPSNPLQPCSIACASFQIITRIFTLICWWFLWPYSHWNVLPLPRHSLIVVPV